MAPLNHNIFNRKNYILAALLLAAILLWVIILRGRAYVRETDTVKAQVALLQADLTREKITTDSLRKGFSQRQENLTLENIDLHNKLDVYEKENKVYALDLKRLSTKQTIARATKDTSAYVLNCDSIETAALEQQAMHEYYQQMTDSTFANYEKQLDLKDSALLQDAKLIAKYEAANEYTRSAADQWQKMYNQVTKKWKRERTLSRVLAISTLILGGITFIK